MKMQDKILEAVLENRASIEKVDKRVSRLEVLFEQAFLKLDGFLTVLDRHETEITALRSRYERLSA